MLTFISNYFVKYTLIPKNKNLIFFSVHLPYNRTYVNLIKTDKSAEFGKDDHAYSVAWVPSICRMHASVSMKNQTCILSLFPQSLKGCPAHGYNIDHCVACAKVFKNIHA